MKKIFTVALGLFVGVGATYSINSFLAEDIDDQILALVSEHNTSARSQGQPFLVEVQKTEQFFGANYRFKLFHEEQEISLPQCLSAELSLRHSPLEWFQLNIASAQVAINFEEAALCPPITDASFEQQILDLFGTQLLAGELTLTFNNRISGELQTNGINFVEDDVALTVAPFIYRFEIDPEGLEEHELSWSGFEFLDHDTRASAYGGDVRYQSSLSFDGEFLLAANSALRSEPIWYSDGQRRSGFSSFETDFSGVVSDGYLNGTGTAQIAGLTLNNLPIGTITETLTLTAFPYQQLSEIALNGEELEQDLNPEALQRQMLQIIAGSQVTVEELSLTNNDAELSINGELKLTEALNAPLDMQLSLAFNEEFIAHLADIQTISSQAFVSTSAADFQAESAKVRVNLEQLLQQYSGAGYLISDGMGGYETPLELKSGELTINGISLAAPAN